MPVKETPLAQAYRDEYPPILKPNSWTKLAPYKEENHSRNVSDTIGNVYSPKATSLSTSTVKGYSQLKQPALSPILTKQVETSPPHSPVSRKKAVHVESAADEVVTRRSYERFVHYVEKEFKEDEIYPLPQQTLVSIQQKLPKRVMENQALASKRTDLRRELQREFVTAQKEAILKYLLIDPAERVRLSIPYVPEAYYCTVSRMPVPWSDSVAASKKVIKESLFITHPAMKYMRKIFDSKYSSLSVFPQAILTANVELPLSPLAFRSWVEKLVGLFKDEKVQMWWEEVVILLNETREVWFVPLQESNLLAKFFASVSALLSVQLSFITERSLLAFERLLDKLIDGKLGTAVFQFRPLIFGNALKFEGLDEFSMALNASCEAIASSLDGLSAIETKLFKSKMNDEIKVPSIKHQNIVGSIKKKVEGLEAKAKAAAEQQRQLYGNLDALISGALALEGQSETLLEHLDALHQEAIQLDDVVYVDCFKFDCSEFKESLKNRISTLVKQQTDSLSVQNVDLNKRIHADFEEIAQKLANNASTTEEMISLVRELDKIQFELLPKLEADIAASTKTMSTIVNANNAIDEDIKWHSLVFSWPSRLKPFIEQKRAIIGKSKADTEKHIRDEAARLLEEAGILLEHVKKIPSYAQQKDASRYVDRIRALHKELTGLGEQIAFITKEEELLGWQKTRFGAYEEAMSMLEPLKKLWEGVVLFETSYETWMRGNFQEVDYKVMEETVDSLFKSFYGLTKQLAEYPISKKVAEMMKENVEQFKTNLPLVSVLRNPGLRARHFQRITEILGLTFEPHKEAITLEYLLEQKALEKTDELSKVAEAAGREASLEKALAAMKELWSPVEFGHVAYRDTGTRILTSCDEIQAFLDDHIVKTQSMQGSPFATPIKEELVAWEASLQYIQALIDEWLQVQSTWLYLEPVFSSEDIMQQMPVEGKKFKVVDGTWRQLMTLCQKDSHVLALADNKSMLTRLKEANILLDEIQKGLNDYLEKKRLFFPRFFFLSNDELLEILSETKDPQRVQPHLKKCFEGIYSLKFADAAKIDAIVSAENEVVPLTQQIDTALARGAVEKWLVEVEAAMRDCVRRHIIKALEAYPITPRSKWVIEWPGQVVLSVGQIYWTTEVEDAIQKGSLVEYRQKCTAQLEEIAKLVRGYLSPMARCTLSALCVIDVHARDVVASLEKSNINSLDAFDWTSQLRYYWDLKDENMLVRMMNATRKYEYEYLGNSSRLVITSLTDRCYRTLISALDMNLGGGPEGTGKTETTKDLAKAIGSATVVFNCSDSLDYMAMAKFFKGVAASGVWCCFDEFNRIDLEVLSVVAQQVLTIQRAVAQKLESFMFEGTKLPLRPSCAVFITMNPGYAGRSELPDNLKALFRPVAMMVPDYALIAEISLYSAGYVHARPLARKIVATFRLCSEQLSSQDHYDYGMRAVKAVLIAASNLKMNFPEEDESVLVLRSITDTNLSKFLQQDIPLFKAITVDLFPGTELPSMDYQILLTALDECMKQQKITKTQSLVDKIIQIYEMMRVRHGFMLVGEPNSGKTTAYQLLSSALEYAIKHLGFTQDKRIIYQVMNPKAVTMSQLYGNFDPVSREWFNGVAANVFREFAMSTEDCRKWAIFDGPIDAIWIENMNTVLDDNKKLCLTNGEIIQLSSSMSVVFEVRDLAVASPATVSRCGMIFMEPRHIGHEARIKSWLLRIEEEFSVDKTVLECFQQMFDEFIPKLKDFNQGRVLLARPEIEWIWQTMNYLSCFLKEVEGKIQESWIAPLFIFSLAWSFGSVLILETRLILDALFIDVIRNSKVALLKSCLLPPGSIFDFVFVCEGTGFWRKWLEETNYLSIPDGVKQLESFMVPTGDGMRLNYLTNLLLKHDNNVLVVGSSGTGKTVTITDLLLNSSDQRLIPVFVNFSAQTSANQTQDLILSKMDKRRRGVMGPPLGKKIQVFIDDLNMPNVEKYGAQPPLELIRQSLDQQYWYDLKDTAVSLRLVDFGYVCACGIGGRKIPPRLQRHLNVIGVTEYEDSTLRFIFSKLLQKHFIVNDFAQEFSEAVSSVVDATLRIYKKASSNLLPIPAKSHYIFNLRDFSRVIVGLMLPKKAALSGVKDLFKLWVHETYRVFYDRLVDDQDQKWLFNEVSSIVQDQYKVEPADLIQSKSSDVFRELVFGCLNQQGDYMQVQDIQQGVEYLRSKLEEYNMLSKSPMALVMFPYALQHVARMTRVLKQQQGHMLLVGVGGSGKQSLARIATFLLDYKLYQLEMSKSYGVADWRDDLKKMVKPAGLEGQKSVFLFSDTQVRYESFLEDLNNLLNTGDVPNLFPQDERINIHEAMRTLIVKEDPKLAQTNLSSAVLFNHFLQRVRANLHIIVCMSPVGDSFRNRLRAFPSFVNCCTIDWFEKWPQDALQEVAQHYLKASALTDSERGVLTVLCQEFHSGVNKLSENFYRETKRRTYVTPTSYLDLLKTIQVFLVKKKAELDALYKRYDNGLTQLLAASESVSVMKVELEELKPVLIKTTKETEDFLVVLKKESGEVDEKRKVVKKDEEEANVKALAAKAIRDECEAELSIALPALQAALDALDTLKPADITLVKSMKNPPSAVKLVIEAICIMKELKPQRVKDQQGKMVDDYWSVGLKMLSDPKFLQGLKEYDKDNIPIKVITKIRDEFKPKEEFQPAVVKNSSSAAEGLCKWVLAMESYDRVAKVVAPKKEKLAQAEKELAQEMEVLKTKQSELRIVEDKLKQLELKFQEMTEKKAQLEAQVDMVGKKLMRAEKLIGGLGGERTRWEQMCQMIKADSLNVVGNMLVSAGIVCYLGPYTLTYRKQIIESWLESLKEKKLEFSDSFSLSKSLEDPVKMREYILNGLPNDAFSRDNALMSALSIRYPLFIDPQGQANRWIRNLESKNKLLVLRLDMENYARQLENAIQFGLPVLLENIGEDMDSLLEPLLSKQFVQQNGVSFVRLGDALVELSPDFRLYLTTKLRNPHFFPEFSTKVNVINFMITPEGLQDQLLGIVCSEERPDTEETRSRLIVESAENKNKLKSIEDQILEILSKSGGKILEDETGVAMLSSSKVLANEINEKQKIAEETEREINKLRVQYEPIAKYATVLFFVIVELCQVEAMYQYSLGWFVQLYVQAIRQSDKNPEVAARLGILKKYFLDLLYETICQSLFKKDKLLFSFIVASQLQKAEGLIDERVWNSILGITLPTKNVVKISWLPSEDQQTQLSGLLELQPDFREKFIADVDKYRVLYDQPSEGKQLVQELSPVFRLALMRLVRPDKLLQFATEYVSETIGQFYVEPPQFSLDKIFSQQTQTHMKPFLFILSPGSDPTAMLYSYASQRKVTLNSISMGQGQGQIAEKMFQKAIEDGSWLLLQNVHLCPSWFVQLERKVEFMQLQGDKINPSFCLWLTSYPSDVFPVAVLQSSVKLVNESPNGLKPNLIRSFSADFIQDLLSEEQQRLLGEKKRIFTQFLYSLCFFHSVLQERKAFGSIGWNIQYEFNDNDLQMSARQLFKYCLDFQKLPLVALRYVTSECNYGGRVTDGNDRRLLNSLMSKFYSPRLLDAIEQQQQQDFEYATGYRMAPEYEKNSFMKFLAELAAIQSPEVYGINQNGLIVRDFKEASAFLSSLLLTQSRAQASSSGGASAIDVANSILTRLPKEFDMAYVRDKFPILYEESMNTVLIQELIRYNKLLRVVRESLQNCVKALKGQIVMSSELEKVQQALVLNKTPDAWLSVSYPSLKPLSGYVSDLLERLSFFAKWIEEGKPQVFWISGFFFTQSFITGVLQNYARANKIPIDQLVMTVQVDDTPSPDSALIRGMFLEGAIWDADAKRLAEAATRQLIFAMPVMKLTPRLASDVLNKNSYACPLYRTSARRGVLSTTGHSTNFVLMMDLPTDVPAEHWIHRGVALMLEST